MFDLHESTWIPDMGVGLYKKIQIQSFWFINIKAQAHFDTAQRYVFKH